jgi:hypothetical protein
MGVKRGRGDRVESVTKYHKTLGSPQLTPAKFRRQLKTTTLSTPAPADYKFPAGLVGDQVYVDLRQNQGQYEGATLQTIEETLLSVDALRSYKRTNDAQTETIDEKLVEETDPPPPLSALVTSMDQEALGDGKSLLHYGTVPYVFQNDRWEIARPRVTPSEFIALIPTQTHVLTEAGTAGPIPLPLPAGVLTAFDEQIDVYRHRHSTGTQDLGVLPITIYGSRTTKDKQVEHIEKTLQLSTVDPDPPTALLDVTWTNLGDGTAIEEHDFVDFLFTQQVFEREITDVIPHRFKALVPIQTTSALIEGIAADPTLISGDLKRTSEQVNVFVVKNTRQFRDITVLPVEQLDYKLTGKLQVSTVANRLAAISDPGQVLAPDYTWLNGSVEDLGNLTSLRTKETIDPDDFFTEASFEGTIPDLIPEKFQPLVLKRNESALIPGTATRPSDPLPAGFLKVQNEQVNAFVYRASATYRDVAGLPVSLPGYRMTQQQQVADVIATLATGLQTITATPLTIEAEVDNLGNGTSIKTESTVDFVFPDDSYTKSILNLIPEKLRAAIPITESSIDSQIPPDVSTNPTLLTGELERTEKRLSVWKKRIMLKKIGTITLPVIKMDHGFTEQNGGDTTTITHTLNTHGSIPVEVGLFVIKSETIDLGNGYDVRTTERADNTPWPTLLGQDYDERLNIILPYSTQTRPANTDQGTPRMDIKTRDRWKQDERQIDLSAVAEVLDPYLLSYPSKINIDMPDILKSVTAIIETAFGEGSNSETGAVDTGTSANFSISMALRASAQSSASMIPDVSPDIVQFWGNNLDCMHYQFYLPQPVTPAAVIAKITALVGAVNNWPKFAPKSVTIAAKGERASVQATASSQGSAAQSTCGTSCPSATSTSAGGTGFSHEKALNLKTVRISPTIHGAINVGGDADSSQPISATAAANASGLGPSESHTEDDSASAAVFVGTVGNRTIPATTGAHDWPSTGLYLYKVDAQPYKYGYVQFHVIIVDAADFPTSA